MRKEGKTDIYCIGDSEQYIYGFTYVKKGQKSVEFNKIPMKKFQNNDSVMKEYFMQEINFKECKKKYRLYEIFPFI